MMLKHDGVLSRMGTFELWHRSAREAPYIGELRNNLPFGGSSKGSEILADADDERMSLLPDRGISLLECFTRIPDMLDFLGSYGIQSQCVRGTISRDDCQAPERSVLRFVIHPSAHADDLLNNLKIHPSLVDRIEYVAFPSGGIINVTSDPINSETDIRLPPGAPHTVDEFRCWIDGSQPLNEFGYMYVALFIAGNYARYYPDRWVFDVENSSPLALAIEELLSIAERRIPWLTLGELSRSYHVFEA